MPDVLKSDPPQWQPLVAVIAGAVAVILSPGFFTSWTTLLGIILLVALHVHGKHDAALKQTFLFSLCIAFATLITIGFLVDWAFFHLAAERKMIVAYQSTDPEMRRDPRNNFEFTVRDLVFAGIWLPIALVHWIFTWCARRRARSAN